MSEQLNQETGGGDPVDSSTLELSHQDEAGKVEVCQTQHIATTEDNSSLPTEMNLNEEPMEQIVSQDISFEMNDFINSCNGTAEQLYFVVENQIGEECLISPLTIDQNVQISFEPNQEIDTQTTQSYIEPNSNSVVLTQSSTVEVSNENAIIPENKLDEVSTNNNIASSELEEPNSGALSVDNNQVADSIVQPQQIALSDSVSTSNTNSSSKLTSSFVDIPHSYVPSEETNPMTKQLSSMNDTSRKYFDNISKDLNLTSEQSSNSKLTDNKISRVLTKSTNNSKIKNSNTQNSILDNFVPKSQLAKSPRTYSRTNIVWITPDSSKNENGLNSNKIEVPKSKSLTTTIEIAESSDDITTNSLSNNKSIVDSVSDEISDTATIDLPPTAPESTTIENVLPLSYDDEKLKEIESLLNEEHTKIDIIKTVEESKILPKPTQLLINDNNDQLDLIRKRSSRAAATKTEIKPVLNQTKKNSHLSTELHKEIKKDSPKKSEVKANSNSDTILKNNKKKVAFNLETNNVRDSEIMVDDSTANKDGPPPEPVVEVEVNVPSRTKERRDVVYYSDFKIDDLSVHIRIQPDIRPFDLTDSSLLCGHCGLNSRSLKLYQIHKKLCSFSSPSKIYNSIKSSSQSPKASNKTVKRQKLEIDVNVEAQASTTLDTNDIEMVADRPVDESNADDYSNESDDASLSSDDTKTLDGHSENDVVWVSTKYGYWPALIIRVLFNERKLSLRLIDCPLKKESLKTQVSSVISFNNASVNKKMLKECKNNNDQLIKAVQKVEEYLRKRCLGTSINPIKFFNFSELFETNNKQPDSTPNVDEGNNKEQTNATRIPSIQIENSKILETIKVEKKVETHLIGVYRGNIHSDFHQKFVTSVEDKSMHSTGFGPFKDGEEKDELIEYLKQLFTNENISFSISYIFEVWAPEAIIKAITRVYHVSYPDAVSIYNSY